MSSKIVTLCADDYGLNPGISIGIRELVEKNRLSAVGCMVNTCDFASLGHALLELQAPIQIGLHLNLTEGKYTAKPTQSFTSLKTLLIKSHLKQLNLDEIIQEFNAQLDCFIDVFGVLPDFLDGHQHIHQFPVIREAVLQVYKQRLKGKWLRCTYPSLTISKFKYKAAGLAFLGAYAFKKTLNEVLIPHNAYFSGIYTFNPQNNYRELFQSWLKMAKPNTLLMCHPGIPDNNYPDPIARSRALEYAYFSSEQFLQDCERFNVTLR